jgi:hypothetical protein
MIKLTVSTRRTDDDVNFVVDKQLNSVTGGTRFNALVKIPNETLRKVQLRNNIIWYLLVEFNNICQCLHSDFSQLQTPTAILDGPFYCYGGRS